MTAGDSMSIEAPLVRFDAIHKSFGGIPVLRDVTLTLPRATVVGLVGENGAGKSTLMNILGGALRQDSGSVVIDGRRFVADGPADARHAGVAFVHQELTLFPNLSIADNLQLVRFPRRFGWWIDRSASRRDAGAALRRVGLERRPDTLVERLAPGERQLVEIARALAHDARVLILDEPTTSLGALERERFHRLVRDLRRDGLTIVYITHELGDVLDQCDRIAVLRDGAVVTEGPSTAFSTDSLVRYMVGREMRRFYPPRREPAARPPVLEVRDMSGGPLRAVTLTVGRGEILGVFGLMGAGRSSLARMIFGLDRPAAGHTLLDGQRLPSGPAGRVAAGVAFVTEDRRLDGLCLEASVADNLTLAGLGCLARPPLGIITADTATRTARRLSEQVCLDDRVDLSAPVLRLSGGNQQKVVLGKWLLRKPRVLLLDEPTRGIDVGARAELYRLLHGLADGGTALLLISSELDELMGVCDRITVLRQGELNGEFMPPDFERQRLLRAALPASVL